MIAASRFVAFKDNLARFGVWPAVCRAVSRRQHSLLGYVRYLCLLLPANTGPPATPALPDGFCCREIDVSELEPLIGVPESNVRGKDLERARAENHRCIGIFAGAQLASYSLNAPASTWLDDTFRLEFPHGWLYHYMAVTLPPWRGKRLHGAQIAAVLRGVGRARGIVTLVSSINYPSRASFHRLGFRKSRSFVVLGHPHRQVLIWGHNAGPFGLVRRSS